MIVVRCVQPGDVDALVALAHETGPGLTTFKPDREALTARVERARRTLARTRPSRTKPATSS